MSHFHAIVWLDHVQARIFEFNPTEADKIKVTAHDHDGRGHHLHRKAGSRDGHREEDNHEFFDDIVKAMSDAREWIVCGPGTARTAFVGYVQARHATVAERIVDVETVDHPTDGELLDLARRRARAIDRMRPQAI